MKKFLSLFFLLAVTLCAKSQVLDTTVMYEWKNNAWEPTQRNIFTNNSQCLSEKILTQNWVKASSQWVDVLLTTNTYTATKKIASSLMQSWNGSAWVNAARMTYSYNNNDLIDSMLTENSPGGTTFQNAYLNVYEYNADLTLHVLTSKLWFVSSWTDVTRRTYTYNADKTTKETVTEAWAFIGWNNQARNRYTYNGNKQQITDTMDTWSFTGWAHDGLTTNTYSGNDLTTELIQDWDGSGWINDNQINYTYNGNGTLAQTISQDWVSNAWLNESKNTFSYGSCILPLTLLNFTGTKKNNEVELKWQTTNEINTSHISVLRSTNGNIFTQVAILATHNNGGSAINTYSFTDDLSSIKSNKVYYKLQMFDKDGKKTESKVITVSSTGKTLQVSIQPNPARTFCVVNTNSDNALLLITSLAGNVVIKQNINGSGSHTINTSTLAKGAYIVRIIEGKEINTQKLIIE